MLDQLVFKVWQEGPGKEGGWEGRRRRNWQDQDLCVWWCEHSSVQRLLFESMWMLQWELGRRILLLARAVREAMAHDKTQCKWHAYPSSFLETFGLVTSLAHVFRFRIRSRRYLGKNACWCSPQKLMDSEFPSLKISSTSSPVLRSTQVAITSSVPLQWISWWVVLLASHITWFQWAERQMTRTSPTVLVETSVETRKKTWTYQDGCLLTCHNLSLAFRLQKKNRCCSS